MNDQPSVRRIGEGYEPHVDEQGGVLIYTFPVDSSFVTTSFSFLVQEPDLDVMVSDPYRRAVLEITAHEMLQRSMHRDGAKVSQGEFSNLVSHVLHSKPDELAQFLARFDRDYHIVTQVYIDQIMSRKPPFA